MLAILNGEDPACAAAAVRARAISETAGYGRLLLRLDAVAGAAAPVAPIR